MREKRIRIAVADDHPLVLAGVRHALEADGGFEVVGDVVDGAAVLPLVGKVDPDVLLLDLRMPGMNALDTLERLRERYPDVSAVVLASESDPVVIEATFRRGACGYIVKTVDVRDLGPSIRQAVDGTAYHTYGLPTMSEETPAREAGLSTRELDVLRAVARGLSNKAVARELWVAEQTVKFHLTNIYRKLGLSNRTEAARWALAHGIQTEARTLLAA